MMGYNVRVQKKKKEKKKRDFALLYNIIGPESYLGFIYTTSHTSLAREH